MLRNHSLGCRICPVELPRIALVTITMNSVGDRLCMGGVDYDELIPGSKLVPYILAPLKPSLKHFLVDVHHRPCV